MRVSLPLWVLQDSRQSLTVNEMSISRRLIAWRVNFPTYSHVQASIGAALFCDHKVCVTR